MRSITARLRRHTPVIADVLGRKTAAVALIVAPGPELLLVRRAVRAGDRWSGHMALPGGRFEKSDKELFRTAVRETKEETGVLLSRARLIGALDDLAPRSAALSPVIVRPFVFLMPERPALRLNEELTGAHWFRLDALARSAGQTEVEIAGKATLVPAFVPESGCVVWGMTHRILTSFLSLALA